MYVPSQFNLAQVVIAQTKLTKNDGKCIALCMVKFLIKLYDRLLLLTIWPPTIMKIYEGHPMCNATDDVSNDVV